MRKIELLKIEGIEAEIMVRELTVSDMIEIYDDIKEDVSLGNFIEMVKKHASKFTSLKKEDFLKLAPSELDMIFGAFRKSNAFFFEIAKYLGINNIIKNMTTTFVDQLSKTFADLLVQDTAEPENMGSLSSSNVVKLTKKKKEDDETN